MDLNVNKCYVISFTRKTNRFIQTYHKRGGVLARTDTVRDLGVIFDEKLSFRPHYDYIVKRGLRLLGFLMRTSKEFKKLQSTLCLFFSLVRSILEYCCPVWSPYYGIHVDSLERVQKRFLYSLHHRHGLGRFVGDYTRMLSKFGVLSLETRRKRYDLLYLHRLLHASIDSPDLLSSLNINTRYKSRFPNTFAIQVYTNNTSYYSPLVRMCRTYNELTRSGRDSGIDVFNNNFSQFKKCLTDYLNDQEFVSPSDK
jgi:hypothetical protein